MKLREIRKQFGIKSARQAASLFDMPYTTYQNYETGDREPDLKTLIRFADYFGVSLDYLTGRSSYNTGKPQKSIPILKIIHAGSSLLSKENYNEQLIVGQSMEEADFALRVADDSMIYAGIRKGDIVLMTHADHADNGRIVAAAVRDRDCAAAVRYYVAGTPPALRAANPKYPDQEITSNHRIIGAYCGLLRTDEPDMDECQGLIARADKIDEEWREAMAELTSAGLGPREVKNFVNMVRMAKK